MRSKAAFTPSVTSTLSMFESNTFSKLFIDAAMKPPLTAVDVVNIKQG
jgi:hypothetical protein